MAIAPLWIAKPYSCMSLLRAFSFPFCCGAPFQTRFCSRKIFKKIRDKSVAGDRPSSERVPWKGELLEPLARKGDDGLV
jgi:hypothetical protein